MSQFKPKYFATSLDSFAKQVVPPSMYNRWREKSLDKMDQRILEFMDEFRHDCGAPLICNDWPWGGYYTQRGVRDVNQYGSYEKMAKSRSDHLQGRAVDLVSPKLTGHQLRLKFIERKDYYFSKYGINFIEVGPVKDSATGKWKPMSWLHVGINLDLGQGVQYWSPKLGFVTEDVVVVDEL